MKLQLSRKDMTKHGHGYFIVLSNKGYPFRCYQTKVVPKNFIKVPRNNTFWYDEEGAVKMHYWCLLRYLKKGDEK